jgi:replicative DNA helicase
LLSDLRESEQLSDADIVSFLRPEYYKIDEWMMTKLRQQLSSRDYDR